MAHKTLAIFGPSGVGKSPLDVIVRPEVLRIEPYRLRTRPRGSDDVMYGNIRLREQLSITLHHLGLSPTFVSPELEWYPKAMTVFLKVRTEWQVLFLAGTDVLMAKIEIYAPVFVRMLEVPAIRRCFGQLTMLVLNPSQRSICPSGRGTQGIALAEQEIAKLTRTNVYKRESRDKRPDETEKARQQRARREAARRAQSIGEELPAWRKLIEMGAVEYTGWRFPEYQYMTDDDDTVRDLRTGARGALLNTNSDLGAFLVGNQAIWGEEPPG